MFAKFRRHAKDRALRDERDAKRPNSPMVPAADAVILDTSFLSIDAALQRAITIVELQKARTAADAEAAGS